MGQGKGWKIGDSPVGQGMPFQERMVMRTILEVMLGQQHFLLWQEAGLEIQILNFYYKGIAEMIKKF